MLSKLENIGTKNKKRVGRGIGSGKGGHTTGRGHKGQKSRSGYRAPRPGFEGGQMPLSRRLPKLKGFSRAFFKIRQRKENVSISELEIFDNDTTVNLKTLIDKGLIHKNTKVVKVIGNDKLTKKLNFEGITFSAPAKKIVEKAGGTIK